jgi:hypothetical protein
VNNDASPYLHLVPVSQLAQQSGLDLARLRVRRKKQDYQAQQRLKRDPKFKKKNAL